MNWQTLFDYLQTSGLDGWAQELRQASSGWLLGHGDYRRWSAALESLPQLEDIRTDFSAAAVTVNASCAERTLLEQALKGLMPWRKGPYRIADVYIDCEWRSDYKWSRVLPHLAPLQGRRILDIGCGNGYHCWRMLAEQPEFVLGIEPSVLFNLQFQALQKYCRETRLHLLPIGIEDMPSELAWFDSVFSMGVLYHRKSPFEHLFQLRDLLRPGGELCLETLVIEGDEGRVLVPENRYARMRNVWFIPSATELLRWMRRCGFIDARVVDETATSVDEQRSTEWMQFESLAQCLDPENPERTVEGYPAPRRAVVIASRG